MQEKVWFENSKGDKLCGILSNPSGDKKKLVVIVAHGFSSSKESSSYPLFEELFNKNNISCLRFDFWGHGESDGDFADITVSEAIDDINNAIKYLKNNNYTNIGLVGSSFGGMVSILAVANSDDIKILGLRAPVSDYLAHLLAKHSKTTIEDWKNNGFMFWISGHGRKLRLNYSFFEDSKQYDGHKEASKIKVPTIIVHGAKDISVPLSQSEQTSKEIKNCKLIVYPKANHWFEHGTDKEDAIKAIVDFFVEKA
ncbi:MAG: alpha/beta fold hydrolase [archaeon]